MANTGMMIGESINPGKGELASLLQRVRKWLLIAAGTTCVGLGFIGIFLPVLPTTPFLLLAAVCYAGSSPRFYRWLMENRWFGQYIKNYREGRGITLKTKIISVTSMCAAILFSAYFFVPWLAGKLVLLAIAVGVSAHILTRPTCK